MTLLEVSESVFRERYEKVPFKVRHLLTEHPAFTLPALRALCLRLPRGDVQHRRGEVAIDAEPTELHLQHPLELPLEATFDQLQETNGYIVVSNPERDAGFRPVADQLMRELLEWDRTITSFSSRLIIASGGSVTPYQLEHGLTLHLQVHGRQLASVWDPGQPEVMSEVERERILADLRSVMPWSDELFLCEQRFEVFPGEGLHQPFIAPHLWRTCEEPSVSWELCFRNEHTDELSAVHRANKWIRRLGVQPTPHGVSPLVDFAKSLGVRAYRSMVTEPGQRASPGVLVPEES